MSKHPKVRTQWDRERVQLVQEKPSMTVQAEAESANMGAILKRFAISGYRGPNDPPQFGTVTQHTAHELANIRAQVRSQFEELPIEEQRRYGHWRVFAEAILSASERGPQGNPSGQQKEPPPPIDELLGSMADEGDEVPSEASTGS